MKVAHGFEPGAVIGPPASASLRRGKLLIDMKAIEKVEARIADAFKTGAKWQPAASGTRSAAAFFEPTVLNDVTPK